MRNKRHILFGYPSWVSCVAGSERGRHRYRPVLTGDRERESEGGRSKYGHLCLAGPELAREVVRKADTEFALWWVTDGCEGGSEGGRHRTSPRFAGESVTGMLASLQRFLFVYIINYKI